MPDAGPVNPMPEGYSTVSPLLHVSGVAKLMEFLAVVFQAVETQRTTTPEGRIVHAEVRIGNSSLMLGEPWGGAPVPAGTHYVYVYVADVDAVYRRALAAGACSLLEPRDQPWGDRLAGLEDPSGIRWWIATHTEDVADPPARCW